MYVQVPLAMRLTGRPAEPFVKRQENQICKNLFRDRLSIFKKHR